MFEIDATQLHQTRRQVRLDTIVRLRWLAVLGQLAAIFVVAHILDFDVPVAPCLAVITFASLLNFILQIAFSPRLRIEPIHAAWLLAFNIAELAALLYLTGGLQNPFAFLFLGPVLISATALPPRLTLALGIFATLCASALGFFHLPLPWANDEILALPPLYMIGVWLSVVLAIGVTSLYAFQVTEQARQLSDALTAAELVLAREQHLTQIDGLAAAAAHELGTPLSTITVIARELERSQPPGSPIADEIKTLREQAQRCGNILAKLTQLSASGAPFDRMALSALIEEAVAPHRHFGIMLHVSIMPGGRDEPTGLRNPAILYGLGNILENAVDFARTRVDVTARWDGARIVITIADDGPGIAPDILRRIGEPYVSRRPRGGEEAAGGLGLGVFIAKTLLERTGATVAFVNRPFPDHGAVVELAWRREDFEREDRPAAPDNPSQEDDAA
ncbi:MAG: HAMP domain-containing histidine kinase [Xanthobacteraceae bacterium]|nr:MAG: HAMP domain-containing histidine kinase [Xanthobacteraceae bacterium]